MTDRDACTRKGQAGEISQKGTKDTILTSYPWTDLRDGHWWVHICSFGVAKGTNCGCLAISGRDGQEHMQQYKEWEYFSFWVELCANFPINACKVEHFISHKLRGLFINRKGTFHQSFFKVESSTASDNAILESRTKFRR